MLLRSTSLELTGKESWFLRSLGRIIIFQSSEFLAYEWESDRLENFGSETSTFRVIHEKDRHSNMDFEFQ